jgi:hypothetical protein
MIADSLEGRGDGGDDGVFLGCDGDGVPVDLVRSAVGSAVSR